MPSFSEFIKKVFKLGKQETKQLFDYNDQTTYNRIIESFRLFVITNSVGHNLIRFLPDIYSMEGEISDEDCKNFLESLKYTKGLFIKSRKQLEDVIFWIDTYTRECIKHGKASEKERPEV